MARSTTKGSAERPDSGWIETLLRPSDPAAMARRSEFVGVIVVGLALGFGAALWTYDAADMDVVHAGLGGNQPINNVIGPVGARIADILLHLFGIFAHVLNALLLIVGLRTVLARSVLPRIGTFAGILGATVATMITTHLWARAVELRPHGKAAAGLFGSAVSEFLRAFLSTTGTLIVALVLLATAVSALAGRPLVREAILMIASRFGWLRQRAATASDNATEQLGVWRERREARKEIEESAKFEAVPAPIPDVFAEEIADEKTAKRAAFDTTTTALRDDEIETDPNAMFLQATEPSPLPVTVAKVFDGETLHEVPLTQKAPPTSPPPVSVVPRTGVSEPRVRPLDAPTQTLRAGSRPSDSTALLETPPHDDAAAPSFPTGTTLRPKEMQVPTAVRRARAQASSVEKTAGETLEETPESGAAIEAVQVAGNELSELGIGAIEAADGVHDARPAMLGASPTNAGPGFAPRIVQTEAIIGFSRDKTPDAEQGKLAIDNKRTWRMPRKALLQDPPEHEINLDHDLLAQNAMTLLEKLHDFKVDGSIENIRPGPVVTTYELKPAKGVRVNKITNLRDDLTMSLAAENVRVVAPIPGKDVVGIEVPNEERQIVYFREVVDSTVWQNSKSPLTIILGKDIEGGPVVADLAKAPHLLVAGATGQGKSVGVNSMIC